MHRRAFGKEAEARLVRLIRESDRFVPDLSLVAELPEFQRRGSAGS